MHFADDWLILDTTLGAIYTYKHVLNNLIKVTSVISMGGKCRCGIFLNFITEEDVAVWVTLLSSSLRISALISCGLICVIFMRVRMYHFMRISMCHFMRISMCQFMRVSVCHLVWVTVCHQPQVVQLYETMMTRHTTMVVGPTGGGKSVVINTLAQAQTK